MKTLGPREATSDQVDATIKYLVGYFKENHPAKACYVYGMGGQRKNTYTNLALADAVSVRLTYNCLNNHLALLSFIPSFAGVVQVLDPSRLLFVMEKIGDSSLTGIYFFNPERDEEFIKLVMTQPHPKTVDDWFNNVCEGIYYQFDPSNGGSKTGMYDWIKIGSAVPASVYSDIERFWV